VRAVLLATTTALAAAASVSCSDLLFGGQGGLAQIVIAPRFSERDAAIYASLNEFNLGVQTLRVVLRRPNTDDVLADTTVTIAEGQDSVMIQLQVVLEQSEEVLTATMEMRSGSILVFQGTTDVIARLGSSAVAHAPPVLVPVWVGPGVQATRIRISPRDVSIPKTGKITFSATAFDANDAVVSDDEYAARWRWVVLDPALASFTPGTSELVASGTTGVVRVVVATPNLLRDTVSVTLTNSVATTISFARGVEIVDVGATKAAPASVKGQDGSVLGEPVTYTSRTPAIATVSSAGTITGVAAGQVVIVASAQSNAAVSDSILAVVAAAGGPVVLSSVAKFRYPTDTTFTVSVFVDMNSSTKRLGSTTIDVEWNPAQLQFLSVSNGGSGVSPTTNTSNTSTGKLVLAMADVAGFTGRVELLRITFKTSSAPSSGELKLTARELNATDYTDLLPLTAFVTHPLSVRSP
jgi:hypothetical protein